MELRHLKRETIASIALNNFDLFPEFFLANAIIFLLFYGSVTAYNKKYSLINTSFFYLTILCLIFCEILIFNDFPVVTKISGISNNLMNDNLALFSKLLICFFSILCLAVTQHYVKFSKINNFEYTLLLLFGIFGLFILCCSNSLLTGYLSIELQSISFYVLASIKRKNVFSTNAGLKYFILGTLASTFFLFGASIIYGISGCINLSDLGILFYWLAPNTSSDINYNNNINYFYNENASDEEKKKNLNLFLYFMIDKIKNCRGERVLTPDYINFLKVEISYHYIDNAQTTKYDFKRLFLYSKLFKEMTNSIEKYSMERGLDHGISYIPPQENLFLSERDRDVIIKWQNFLLLDFIGLCVKLKDYAEQVSKFNLENFMKNDVDMKQVSKYADDLITANHKNNAKQNILTELNVLFTKKSEEENSSVIRPLFLPNLKYFMKNEVDKELLNEYKNSVKDLKLKLNLLLIDLNKKESFLEDELKKIELFSKNPAKFLVFHENKDDIGTLSKVNFYRYVPEKTVEESNHKKSEPSSFNIFKYLLEIKEARIAKRNIVLHPEPKISFDHEKFINQLIDIQNSLEKKNMDLVKELTESNEPLFSLDVNEIRKKISNIKLLLENLNNNEEKFFSSKFINDKYNNFIKEIVDIKLLLEYEKNPWPLPSNDFIKLELNQKQIDNYFNELQKQEFLKKQNECQECQDSKNESNDLLNESAVIDKKNYDMSKLPRPIKYYMKEVVDIEKLSDYIKRQKTCQEHFNKFVKYLKICYSNKSLSSKEILEQSHFDSNEYDSLYYFKLYLECFKDIEKVFKARPPFPNLKDFMEIKVDFDSFFENSNKLVVSYDDFIKNATLNKKELLKYQNKTWPLTSDFTNYSMNNAEIIEKFLKELNQKQAHLNDDENCRKLMNKFVVYLKKGSGESLAHSLFPGDNVEILKQNPYIGSEMKLKDTKLLLKCMKNGNEAMFQPFPNTEYSKNQKVDLEQLTDYTNTQFLELIEMCKKKELLPKLVDFNYFMKDPKNTKLLLKLLNSEFNYQMPDTKNNLNVSYKKSDLELLVFNKIYRPVAYLQNVYLANINYCLPYFLKAEKSQEQIFLETLKELKHDSFYKFSMQTGLLFIAISIFFKLTLSPFHFWAPDVYEGSPTSSTVFFTIVPKIAIFVFFYRLFYSTFFCFFEEWNQLFEIIIIISVIIASFGGLEQTKMKSLMSYSSISHSGYLMIAFVSGTLESMQIFFFYLIIYMLSMICIWSVFVFTKVKCNYTKKFNKNLTDLLLLNKSNTMLSIVLSIALFSMAGIPPLIGFLAKASLFFSSISTNSYILSTITISCSVISSYYYLKIIKLMFFENALVGKLYYPIKTNNSFITIILCFILIYLFINPTLLILLTYKISLLFFNG